MIFCVILDFYLLSKNSCLEVSAGLWGYTVQQECFGVLNGFCLLVPFYLLLVIIINNQYKHVRESQDF